MTQVLTSLCHCDDGQDMVEYVLILAFVAISAAAIMVGMNTDINAIWSVVNSRLASANN